MIDTNILLKFKQKNEKKLKGKLKKIKFQREGLKTFGKS